MTLAISLLAAVLLPADEKAGEQVYRRMCVACHGQNGEGSKDNPEPLAGLRNLASLTQYIEKRMPKDKPGTCKGADAKNVAEYIFSAFYSPAAQARNTPPRIELSRLTVRQYRNAVADLVATFTEPGKADARTGLRGEYFNSGRRIREDKRAIDRVDSKVDFTFAAAPIEKAEEYAVRWSGSVFPPDTGEYEFIVETENGARLWVNDLAVPLIDVWVRSGTEKKHRESAFLLAGRAYPIRLEMFKEKKEKSASISLKWKRPHRSDEFIPATLISPARTPEVLVVKTAFPPDDRSYGYERSSSISKAWDEAATGSALELASYVISRLDTLTGTRLNSPDARQKLQDFCRRFAERAFRRPLTPELQALFVDRQFEGAPDLETAVKKSVLLALKSPRFLYHDTDPGASDAYDVASRISFGVWDSLPDRELLDAAKAGKLESEGIVRQIERMLPDPRGRAKIREFYHQWLQLDRIHELSKDAKQYPEFTEAVVSDLRTSLDLLLEDVTWSETSDFRQLLVAETVHLNGRLANIYGADLPEDAPFQKIKFPNHKQSGIMTHPLVMAGFAYDATTSPIHRGLFVARSLLGKRLRPPPEAVTPLVPTLHPDLTTRERVALQTRPQACMSCHSMINPLGFVFENYDAVGRFRGTEKGKPIDASGSYIELDGNAVKFNGARQLGEYLAANEETQSAVVEHIFQYFVKQPVRAYGLNRPEILRARFVKDGFSVRKLLVQVIATSAGAGAAAPKGKEK